MEVWDFIFSFKENKSPIKLYFQKKKEVSKTIFAVNRIIYYFFSMQILLLKS